jgi:hypothetical protein
MCGTVFQLQAAISLPTNAPHRTFIKSGRPFFPAFLKIRLFPLSSPLFSTASYLDS